jgi:hypothetical protein
MPNMAASRIRIVVGVQITRPEKVQVGLFGFLEFRISKTIATRDVPKITKT